MAATCHQVKPARSGSAGPDCFVGYTDPAVTAAAFSPDGWYMTGDVGVLDADGYLAITDRKKDIIIRGGENVSAAEVEEILMRMPGVAEVAVVAAPDERLGEIGCAHFRMLSGVAAPDLADMRAELERVGLARQKWPEQIRETRSSRVRRAGRSRSSSSGSACVKRPDGDRPDRCSRAARRRACARRQPLRLGPAVHVPARIDGRRGDLGRVAAPIDEPAPAPVRAPLGGSTREYVDGALSIPFLKRSRGKRSVALDLTRREGASLVRTLAERSDVLVENSRSDAMEGFGLGYEQLSVTHPLLVYCAISGYGYDAPDRPAMDNIVQAMSGVMAKTGFADGPPVRAGITIADHTSATFAALGILAALRQREATGRGQLVDVAMLDVLTALVWDEPVDYYAAIGMPPRTGNADGRGAPINTYRCADGWISVTCTSDSQWQRLCNLMERDDALQRWPTIRERVGAAGEIDAAVEAWTSTRPVREVESAFLAIGLPAGRVRDPIEAATDPALAARGLLTDLRHPAAPPDRPSGFLGPRLPISFAGRVELPPAEQLGTSTDSVLRELAGCDDGDLSRLAPTG